MQNQSPHTLNEAIKHIATLLKPKFDATGPMEDSEEKEVQSMVSQIIPGIKHMDVRMRALEKAACGVIDDVHVPARQMWGHNGR